MLLAARLLAAVVGAARDGVQAVLLWGVGRRFWQRAHLHLE
jgi:hypothetical protein